MYRTDKFYNNFDISAYSIVKKEFLIMSKDYYFFYKIQHMIEVILFYQNNFGQKNLKYLFQNINY